MHLSELFCMINCNNRQLERAGFYIYSLHKYFIAFNELLNANIFFYFIHVHDKHVQNFKGQGLNDCKTHVCQMLKL